MQGDGSVLIPVRADTKAAQKELSQLERKLQKTQETIEKTGTKRNAIAEQLDTAKARADELRQKIADINNQREAMQNAFNAAGPGQQTPDSAERYRSEQDKLLQARQQVEKELAEQEKAVGRLERQEQTVTNKLQEQTEEYTKQQKSVADLRRQMMLSGGAAMEKLKAGSRSVQASFKNILKYAFGIRSLYILVSKVRSGIKEGFQDYTSRDPETKQNIESLKASLNGLKLSWGAAFAPIVNIVAPYLQKLIEWLTAAGNAIARFFAVLSGKTTYKKAVANMNSVGAAASGAGNAAEEAKKQVMGFDELNKLNGENSNSGSGGGGGGSLGDMVEEAIDMDSFAAKLAFTVRDVLFNWDDLTPEQIAEKALAGLTMLGGAIVGGMIGGVHGIIIGALAGLAVGILLDATIFNADGELSRDELIRALLSAALFVGGLVAGFVAGGPMGAMIGASVGLLLAFNLANTMFNADGTLNKNGLYNALTLAIGAFGGAGIGLALGGPLGAAIGLGLGLLISFGLVKIDWGKVQSKITEWYDGIKEYFQGYIDKWKESGNDESNGVGFYVVAGFLEGIWNAAKNIAKWVWDHLTGPFIKSTKDDLEIGSPSKVFERIGEYIIEGLKNGIEEKWNNFIGIFEGLWDDLKNWWENLTLNPFHIPHPIFEWGTKEASGLVARALEFVGLPATLPTLSISWAARGGIVDGATLIGAGEAGKEAIIPLERNTGWITDLAESLFGVMENRFSGAMAGLPMPAMAMGAIAPPRTVSGGTIGFSDADISRLVSGVQAALAGTQNKENPVIKLYIDGRQVYDVVSKYDRQSKRAAGG